MSQIMVGPNDIYIVKIAQIIEMAEKNGAKNAVKALQKLPATFAKFSFKETEEGFIELSQDFLDENKNKLEDVVMSFNDSDVLSFIGKFDNVEKIQGQPLDGKLRTVNSVVKTEYESFHDGDIYHLPYNDFIKALSGVATDEHFDDYKKMKEYGIEHIFFTFHYPDHRSSASNRLYGFYKDEKAAIVNPYYEMVFDIWATDAKGTYFFEGADKVREGQDPKKVIADDIRKSRRQHDECCAEPETYSKVSEVVSRLGHKNINTFFNNYKFAENLTYVNRIRSDDKSFISSADMSKAINKIAGYEYIIQAQDSFKFKTQHLSSEVKEKYNIAEDVQVLFVEVIKNEDNSNYLELKASVYKNNFIDTPVNEFYLLKDNLKEIILDYKKNKGLDLVFSRNRKDVDTYIAEKHHSRFKPFSKDKKGISFEKPYLLNISHLESLGDKKLNKELEKLKALGDEEVIVSLKQDFPYKFNGKKEIVMDDFKFEALCFPELDIYAFNNKTGKGYDPEILKSVRIGDIFNDEDKVRTLLDDKSKDDIFPKNNRNLISASLFSLESNAISELVKEQSPLIASTFETGFYSEKTELNLYMVSAIGEERLVDLSENINNENTLSRPKMK